MPTVDAVNDLENRLIRLLRDDQQKNTLFFRYGDLCALETIQVDIAPERQGTKAFGALRIARETTTSSSSLRISSRTHRLRSNELGK